MTIARQRARARRTARTLAEISAAKEVIEASAAQKSRLLAIAAHDLSESEALFRERFRPLAAGISRSSRSKAQWLRVNQALCQIVGYTEGRDSSRTTFQAITYAADLDDRPRICSPEVLRGEVETYHLDKRYIHRDRATSVWISDWTCRVHRDAWPQGEPRHFISQVQDITEQRRAARKQLLHQAKEEAESGQRGQKRVPLAHEPRTAYAAQRDPGVRPAFRVGGPGFLAQSRHQRTSSPPAATCSV